MTDVLSDLGPSDVAVWVGLNGFDPDPGERLEALATSGPGPLRTAARVAVSLDARLGRWRRPVPARATTARRPEPAAAASRREPPAVGGTTGDAQGAGRGQAASAGQSDHRRRADVTRSPAAGSRPARRRRPLVAATRRQATGKQSPAVPDQSAASREQSAVAPKQPPAAEATPAASVQAPPAAPRPAKRRRPLVAATRQQAGAPSTRRTSTQRAESTPHVFPGALIDLTDHEQAGVCEDDAWERWVASNDSEHLQQLTADLDRAPSRVERAEANLQRAGALLRRRPWLLAGS